jgi:hypothetical protein
MKGKIMANANDLERLVKERDDAIHRERQLKEEIIDVLFKEGMTDFFTVNWNKLTRVFVHGRRR